MPQRTARFDSTPTETARSTRETSNAANTRGLAGRALRRLRHLGAHPMVVATICAAVIGATVGIFGFSGWSVGVPVVVIAAVLAFNVAHPRAGLFYPVIAHGSRAGNRVALSFDDGPDPKTTPRVLDALTQYGARATFFVIGRKLAEQPELAHRVVAEGHELGNHSWRHSRFQNLRGTRFHQQEIERGAAAIAATGQSGTPLYRPPMGLKSPHLAHAARRLGLSAIVSWSLRSGDTHANNPECIAQRVLRKVRPGDIILLHDGHDLPGRHRPACAKAVALILQGLKERNLDCVTLPELLQPASRLKTDAARHGNLAPHTLNLK
ncbi:MAG: polysaccharide deacetylase family protein [Gammaproteobacteria bacterium]